MSVDVAELRLPGPGARTVPVLTVNSGRPGPNAVVTANLHGDEATGVGAVHALTRRLEGLLRRGRVTLYPSLNPAGLASGVRGLPGEELDPNRAFPGEPAGKPVIRHAYAIWTDLLSRRPDVLVDLHTDAGGAVPYALADRVIKGGANLEDRCAQLAEASGLFALREYPVEEYLRYHLEQSLAGAMANHAGVPAVTLEVGPRRWIAQEAVAIATDAALGVLSAVGLTDTPAPVRPERRPGRWRRAAAPRPRGAGVLVPLVGPGDEVEAGEALAEVRRLDGELVERVLAAETCVVLALAERAWATPSLSFATLAVRDGGAASGAAS